MDRKTRKRMTIYEMLTAYTVNLKKMWWTGDNWD